MEPEHVEAMSKKIYKNRKGIIKKVVGKSGPHRKDCAP
jgi:hypothetical protein